MSNETFDVWQFLEGDVQEKVRDHVSAEEAVKAFKHYTSCVAAQMSVTLRVIIVDRGDSTVAEWKKGEGLVWPPKDAFNKEKLS